MLAVGSTLGDELTTGVGLGCEPLGEEQATNTNSRLPVASRSQRESERGFGMVLLLSRGMPGRYLCKQGQLRACSLDALPAVEYPGISTACHIGSYPLAVISLSLRLEGGNRSFTANRTPGRFCRQGIMRAWQIDHGTFSEDLCTFQARGHEEM